MAGTWSHNDNNELLGYADVSFEYDNNGNMTQKTVGDQVVNYVYDITDRLIRVEDGDGSVIAEYSYDPFGRRLWKEVGGVRTCYLYVDEGLVGEYDSSGNEIKTYGYAPDSVWTTNALLQSVGGNYYWYQNDHLGTSQKIVDTSGRVVWSAAYDAFGNIQLSVAEVENDLRFPGQYYDAETGLYYNWNRYYDPVVGRYLRTDPFNEGVNLYAYVFGNPINLGDPEGLCVLKGAGKTIAFGLIAVPAVIAVTAICPPAGAVLAVTGAAMLGVSTGELIMGETITGRSISGDEWWERLGGVSVGWAALGYGAYKTNAFHSSNGTVRTPHGTGTAVQSNSAEAQAALRQVRNGNQVFRQGGFGVQNTSNAQFWSVHNPAGKSGYANKMGMPTSGSDWIMGGTIKPGANVVTRPAPGIGSNVGGAMEAVVGPGGVQINWFYMP